MLKLLEAPLQDDSNEISPEERNHKLILQAEVMRARYDIPRLKRKLRRRARRQRMSALLFPFLRK